jgi:periplasmic protein TonB
MTDPFRINCFGGVRLRRVDFPRDRISARLMVSLCAVVLLHVAILYAFVTGTARRVVRSIARPIETKIIVDTKPLPPPRTNMPPPKLDAPRLSKMELPYIPVPEIHIQQPPERQNAISAVTNVKPETSAAPAVPTHVTPEALTPKPPTPGPPVAVLPPAPIAAARPEPVRVPPVIDAARNCKKPSYPPASIRLGETGTVLLRFLIDTDGRVKSSEVQSSSGHTRLDEAAREALSLCRFKPGISDGQPVEAWATLRYTWVLQE